MQKTGKLELTWVGKYDEIKVEPRILIEDISKSYGDPSSENMLIHGDNLIALQALQQDYSGKIKCIYIDPPYNTGSRIDSDGNEIGYDDGLEHSEWLQMMKSRLTLLKTLLSDTGLIFVQIDDNEQAYLKVLMDEIFGRRNYVNTIVIKAKAVAGASGGGEDKRLKKNYEFVLIYAKDYDKMSYTPPTESVDLIDYINEHREKKVGFYYTRIIKDYGRKVFLGTVKMGNGEEMEVYEHLDFVFSSISKVCKEEGLSEAEAYAKYYNDIFMVTNAQTSLLTRINDFVGDKNRLISYVYTPSKGKSKGKLETKMVWNKTLIVWLRDTCQLDNGRVTKIQKQGTLWSDISWGRLDLEGAVDFKKGKKPEALLLKLIEMATDENDYVLDSFLGSGTTAAVALKAHRRWIGIEIGPQCFSHCKTRLDSVINGEQGGVSKMTNWHGGGGYHFYELAPSLLVKNNKLPIYQVNPKYTFEMLCEAICKIEGFKFKPVDVFHGKSSERRFIHVTKEFVNVSYLKSIASHLDIGQSLLVYGLTIQSDMNLPDNIEVKKIPKDLLEKCDFECEVL
jgi:adenine-specific DNA-methyltransferase